MLYISLLRGINVGGHKIIKMADLKNLYENLGFTNIETYIQSGNVIFHSDLENTNEIKENIEIKIKETYNFDVSVIMIMLEELKEISNNNPFLKEENIDIKNLYVAFTNENININSNIIKKEDFVDKFVIDKKVIYIFYPNGAGKAKLNNDFFEKKLKTIATSRNLNTIEKLIAMGEKK